MSNILKNLGVSYDFTDKVVLVTGGSSGIGKASAIAFAESGAKVAVLGYSENAVNETVSEMSEYDVLGLTCDVADEMAVKDTIDKVIDIFGKLDIAFNNAGVQISHEPLADMTTEDFTRIIDINLKGVYNCMKYEIPYMQENGYGVILNTSSQGGLVAIPTISGYTASKHGVIGLTTSAAIEYARENIRINVICPGTCETPMVEKAIEADPEQLDIVIDAIPLGRMGTSEELAATVLFLCSDAAGFMVGQVVAVDGGYTAV